MLGQKRESPSFPRENSRDEKTRMASVIKKVFHFHGKSSPLLIQEQVAILTVTEPSAVTCLTHYQVLTQSLPEAKLGPCFIY